MSMLSEQRDKLRKVAGELQSIIDGLNKGRITYDSLMDTLNYGIQCLNGAADIIWQLRNDCVDLRIENRKLRELIRRAHGCKTDDGCCEDCWGDYGECPIEAKMRELGIEVSKLGIEANY